jgi:hypothetical protein
MSWHKVTLDAERNAAVEPLLQIISTFAAIVERQPPPSGVGIFPQRANTSDYSFSVYFSPACAQYCPEYLNEIHAVPCEKPFESGVAWLLGHPTSSRLLSS